MHVKGLKPLRLSGRPAHPHKKLAWLPNIGGERQAKFHVRGYVPGVVSGASPCAVFQQGTKICISNNNWEESLVNTIRVLANFPLLSVGIPADRPSTGHRETR